VRDTKYLKQRSQGHHHWLLNVVPDIVSFRKINPAVLIDGSKNLSVESCIYSRIFDDK
jgi:hypothetical protein